MTGMGKKVYGVKGNLHGGMVVERDNFMIDGGTGGGASNKRHDD
jgi:hypothetical protein